MENQELKEICTEIENNKIIELNLKGENNGGNIIPKISLSQFQSLSNSLNKNNSITNINLSSN